MPVPNLADLVASLDGKVEVGGSLKAELNSIALPPLFRNDLDEWLDLDLLQSSLTEAELSLIRRRDDDYVAHLRHQRREHARLLKVARDSGSLAEAPGIATSPARRIFWEISRLRGDDRCAKAEEFSERLRADLDDPDAGLYAFLQSTVESFVWRPAVQRSRDWLDDQESRAHVEQLIDGQLNTSEDEFLEIAYYWGILYNIFPKDSHPSPLVISTDHETAWQPHDIHSEGPLNDFLSRFLDVGNTVSLVAGGLG